MLFDNGIFLIVLPVFFLLYYSCPKRCQRYILLSASLAFAYCQNIGTLLSILIFSIIVYYYSRLVIVKEKYKTILSIMAVLLILSILFIVRYKDFALLGISFYSLRIIGYVIDVYKGQAPEERLFNVILFVSYFPLLPAGPIEKSRRLLCEFCFPKEFSEGRAYKGFIYLLIGYFMKFVIADRCSVIVDAVYSGYEEMAGSICLIAIILYSIQIYCDFAGYSYIALGISEVLGVTISENFKRPYLAKNIKEFWERWHISLSAWLKEYIYIPLGGNRKGIVRKEINILITFLVSGLWHGQGIHFIVWGIIHGIYRVIGDIKNRVFCKQNINNKFIRVFVSVFTFILVSLAWVFFRATNTKQAISLLKRVVCNFGIESLFNGDIYLLGWGRLQLCGIALACCELFCYEILLELGFLKYEKFMLFSYRKRNVICYIILLWILISVIQAVGINQDAGFIYANF